MYKETKQRWRHQWHKARYWPGEGNWLQTQIVGRRDRPVWVGLHWARWAGLTRIFLFTKNRNFMNNRPQWRNFRKNRENGKIAPKCVNNF